ncbi:MAG TPA: hypothetical protein VF009_03335 [Solirubrobacterales bacterium]
MNRLIIAGIGALATALLAAGCGGGSDEATAQVSKAEFYKQARAICAKTQKKVNAELAASKSIAAASGKLGQLRETEAEELEAIPGPEAVEEEVKSFIATVLKASRQVAREGPAAANDPSLQAYVREAASLHLNEC